MMKDKKVLGGGAVLLIAVFWFYIKPNYMDAKAVIPPTEAEIAAAPRPTLFIGKSADPHAESASSGVVFNLKAPGTTPNYAKVIMAIEFEDPKHTYVGVTGAAAIIAKNVAFAEELDPEMHKILDVITGVFGAKTLAEINSTEGKEKLKEDLIEGLNHELHTEKVEAIYFESFITQ